MNWIILKKFSVLSGYTPKAVYNKISRGQWTYGVHYKKAPDGKFFINAQEVENWVRGI